MSEKNITRRELLKKATAVTIGSAIYFSLPQTVWAQSGSGKTKVVLIRDQNLFNADNSLNEQVATDMLSKAVVELTGKSNAAEAWKSLIKPTDVVGIKTNEWNSLRTPAVLEDAIKEGVLSAGVKDSDVSVNDRGVLRDDVFKRSTALINIRPMRAHAWSGVGTLLKNYIMFADKPSVYHPDSCASLAELWELPIVKGKTRLNILVMHAPLFHGVGSQNFNSTYTWPYSGILVGIDPVAVDYVGLSIIQAKRNQYFGEDKPLNPPAKHIFMADTKYNLGTTDPKKIELVKLGWDKDILI
jgi:hypothetical protein